MEKSDKKKMYSEKKLTEKTLNEEDGEGKNVGPIPLASCPFSAASSLAGVYRVEALRV